MKHPATPVVPTTRIFAAVAVSILLTGSPALLGGCGGSKPLGSGSSSNRTGTVRFLVHWPGSGSRLIPSETNRVIVFVNGPGIFGTVAYVVDKPTFGTTSTIDVPVPVGDKRVFSAEARKVDQTQFASPQRLPMDSPVLKEGILLGCGRDDTAHTVGLFQTVVADIEIREPAQPGPDTTEVHVTVNQVLTESFPSVIVLEILRDQDGNPLTNLTKANFEILEDGQPAVITDVRTVLQAAQDLSVVLVLDRSGSMTEENNDLETAAADFINLMQPGDAGEIINFSTKVRVDQTFTTDKALLLSAVQHKPASGDTALWDAVGRAVADISGRSGRRAVIAMTDGHENASRTYTKSSVISAAQTAGVPVFTVGLGDDVEPGLPDVANQTGGIHVNSPTSQQLLDIYRRISAQLAGQLQISFISPDPTVSGRERQLLIRFHYGSFSGETSFTYRM